MLGLLRQRRWLGFTLLSVFFVVLFIRLSVWQVSRLHQREAANDVERAHLAAAPMTFGDLVALARSDPSYATDQQWRAVRITGAWDTAHQVVVRNRVSDNGDDGYEVVTPIRSAGGGPALLIDRGWIPKGHSPTGPDSVPAAQGGTVTITARLLPSEPSRPTGGLPAGQVLAISTTDVGHLLPYQPLAAFAVLTAESPTPHGAPTVRLGPVLDDGPHLSYAVQWVLFALVAVGGWWTFLRREAEEAAELTGAGRPALDDHADTDPAGNDRAEAAPAVDGRASPDPPTQQAITTG